MDQPDLTVDPARSQLNKENDFSFSRALEFSLARRVRTSRPKSLFGLATNALNVRNNKQQTTTSFYTITLNLVLYYSRAPIPHTAIRDDDGVHLRAYTVNLHSGSVPSLLDLTQNLHSDGVHRQESTGTGSVTLNDLIDQIMKCTLSAHD